jgi:hypothetical protein
MDGIHAFLDPDHLAPCVRDYVQVDVAQSRKNNEGRTRRLAAAPVGRIALRAGSRQLQIKEEAF